MIFILATGWEEGIADLTRRLIHELADNKRVLWLVSGGSNIPASVEVMDKIAPQLSKGLSIMAADERYGPEGHQDSNWASLLKAGFKSKQATLLPVLRQGKSFTQTLAYYRRLVAQALKSHDVVIAQLGIGSDGHIAGILPGSAAAEEDQKLVVGYRSESYTRLTLTFPALRQVDHAYVFAFGNAKHDMLTSLHDKRLSLKKQPAQILKRLKVACVYNDQLGDDT